MNTNQIPEETLIHVLEDYVSECVEDAHFIDRFTNWSGDAAKRFYESRKRLSEEFSSQNEKTFDDAIGVRMAEAYEAYSRKDYQKAVEALEHAAAVIFRGIRYLRVESGSDSNC